MEKDKTIIDELQLVMTSKGYLEKTDIERVSTKCNRPLSEVYGVATFYSQFKLVPSAKYKIEVCTGTACYILGAELVIKTLKERLKIELFQNTSDGKYNLSTVRCLGCCGQAPVVAINGKFFYKVTPKSINEILDQIDRGDYEL